MELVAVLPSWVGVRVCHLLLLLLHQFTWHTDRQLRLIHLPSACRGRTAVRFPANSSHMCCVELVLKAPASAVKSRLHRAFSPISARRLNIGLLVFSSFYSKALKYLAIEMSLNNVCKAHGKRQRCQHLDNSQQQVGSFKTKANHQRTEVTGPSSRPRQL